MNDFPGFGQHSRQVHNTVNSHSTKENDLEKIMTEANHDLIVVMTKGLYDEVSSVGLVLATGAQTAGMNVGLFLTSSAIDLVRKNGINHTHVAPMEPLKQMLDDFIARGGKVWVCPPCTKSRGYDQSSLIEGVEIHGASVIFERIKKGAKTLTL